MYVTQMVDVAIILALVLRDTQSPVFLALKALTFSTLDAGRAYALVDDPVVLEFLEKYREGLPDLRKQAYEAMYSLA